MAGRKQPQPFNPERAALLDDPERERWLPTGRIVEMLDVRDGMNILDYGTGTGRYALSIARTIPQAHVVAFDIQQPMLDIVNEYINQSGLNNVLTIGPDPAAVIEGHFDRVLGVHLLHEIDGRTFDAHSPRAQARRVAAGHRLGSRRSPRFRPTAAALTHAGRGGGAFTARRIHDPGLG